MVSTLGNNQQIPGLTLIPSDSRGMKLPAPSANIQRYHEVVRISLCAASGTSAWSSAVSLTFGAAMCRMLLGEDLSSGYPRERPFGTF
jgi:hypothetical protein